MKQINYIRYIKQIFSQRNFSGECQWHYIYANITNFCKWMKNFCIQIPHKILQIFMRFIKISIIQYIKNNIAKSFSKKRKNLNKLFYKNLH